MAELFVNDPGTTLAAAITSTGATTLQVASGTGYPVTGDFRIRIGDEIMLVTGVSGTTWTVTRGLESTTATTHLISAAVNHVFTAGAVTAIVSGGGGGATSGAIASIPTEVDGTSYYPTDTSRIYVGTGGAWKAWGPIYPLTDLPSLGTWLNQGSATYSTASGNGVLIAPGNAGDSLRCVYRAAPASTPWTVTALLSLDTYMSNYTNAGIFLYDNISGRIQTFNIGWVNGMVWSVVNWTSATGYNSTPAGPLFSVNSPQFFRVYNDGTNLVFSTSFNGQTFNNVVWTTTITGWLTNGVTHIGLFADSNNSKPIVLTCYSLSIT